ncbi:biorientation of chromosomes in cell division protein 1-like 1 [Eurosta solidaginis]|uniref:biorientation of chromosomes in cell division protein 1-like 1 n=1 Tax=Eurosta solidaginis TaxID=178769 RepID=UPI0035305F22
MNSHLDPQFEDQILHEVKSQGVFDEFRKDSIADVDTKPAYQNLRQRVENTVKKFLSEQQWSADMNKNQLRERLRRHITEAGFLDVGVERIVDQVVNPKISSVFQPRIEEITYKYLGLPPPPKHEPPPPIMHPLPPLPLTGQPLQVDTSSLLPTGLEQISPDSDKATVKSECREDDQSVQDMDIDNDDKNDDDDESPPFELLVKKEEANNAVQKTEILIKNEEDFDKPTVSTPKKESLSAEKTEKREFSKMEKHENSLSANTSGHLIAKSLRSSLEADAMLSQDSQLSQVSSDSRISDVTANASHSFMDDSSPQIAPETISDPTETAMELASANISEEAQMPKFNENTSDLGAKSNSSELHFDIKKDEIKFEGTDRKSNNITVGKTHKPERHFDIKQDEIKFEGTNRKSGLLAQERESNSMIENGNSPNENITLTNNLENKEHPHNFSSLTSVQGLESVQTKLTPTTPPTPTPHDSSFGSSLEDASNQIYLEHSKNGIKNHTANAIDSVFSTPIHTPSRKETSAAENRGSSSSSSRHKKHSKDKRHSHESKEKHKDKERSKKSSKSKDKYKSKDRDGEKEKSRDKSKHKNSKDRHRHKESEGKEKDRSKDKERSRKEHKHSRSRHGSNDRSSNSKYSSLLNTVHDTSSSKYEKSGTSKHATSLASYSSSSSRSESHHESKQDKHNKRHSEKKSHRSASSNNSSTKKADIKPEGPKPQIAVDDHNIEKMKEVKRRSSDSNDEDKGGGGGGANGASGRNASLFVNISSNGSSLDKQSQQKDIKNISPSSKSSNGKANNSVLENSYKEKDAEVSNTVDKTCDTGSVQELSIQSQRNKVFILSDMLENPNINFIDLGPTKTAYSLNSNTPAESTTQITSPKKHTHEKKEDPSMPAHIGSKLAMERNQLLFFEVESSQFTERLRLLNYAMDGCRRVVNNLRFDCLNEFCDGLDTLENQHRKDVSDNNVTAKTCATLTIDCIPAYTTEDYCCRQYGKSRLNSLETTTRKRDSNGQFIYSTPSPTLSDVSISSKENVASDKNSEVQQVKRARRTVNKSTQQRYNNEDLYKPRPVLSQRSRRRGMNAIV